MTDFIFLGSTEDGECSHEIKRHLLLERKGMTDLVFKKQRHYFVNKGSSSQGYGFSSSHVWMWKLDHKEAWVSKYLWFWSVALKKTFWSPLDSNKIKQFNPKENQPWIFIGRTDADAEAPIIWPPNMKSLFVGKTMKLGKIEGRRWREQQRMRCLHDIIYSMDMSLRKFGR